MFQRYKLEMVGITPMLMHWDNLEWSDLVTAERTRIKEKDKANFKAGDDRCPADTWKGYAYHDDEYVALPSYMLHACLSKAGAKVTYSKQTTFKKIIPAAVQFDAPFADFTVGGKRIAIADINAIQGDFPAQVAGARALGFDLLAKRAKVGSAKHVRVRPMFKKWTAAINFTIVDPKIDAEAIGRVIEAAGMYIGVGDWRPGSPMSPGTYGKFNATMMKA